MTYVVDAVDHSLRLLTFVAEHPGLGVTELATKLGLNKSRTYRMLYTLEQHRFVVQDTRSATYSLGVQAFVVGVAAAQQNTLVRSAHRHMLALSQSINETVVLRVREGLETICVARCETSHQVRAVGAVGNRRPVNSGASGKVLLAFASDAVRAEYLAGMERPPGAPTVEQIVDELAVVTHNGYAVSIGEVTTGAAAIAVPVRDLSGAAIAAVSISGPQARIGLADVPGYLKQLLACSAAISDELGYSALRIDSQPA